MPVSRAEIVYESSCKLKCICILIIVSVKVEGGRRGACRIRPVSSLAYGDNMMAT
jgi:hypothetical protein